MIQLIYISSATRPMTEHDLVVLLQEARERNATQQVTGMLLYRDGAFLQVLEGAAEDVDDIYRSILRDERNGGHYLVERRTITERSFPDWTMGFEDLSRHRAEDLEGYSDLFSVDRDQVDAARFKDRALSLLLKF